MNAILGLACLAGLCVGGVLLRLSSQSAREAGLGLIALGLLGMYFITGLTKLE